MWKAHNSSLVIFSYIDLFDFFFFLSLTWAYLKNYSQNLAETSCNDKTHLEDVLHVRPITLPLKFITSLGLQVLNFHTFANDIWQKFEAMQVHVIKYLRKNIDYILMVYLKPHKEIMVIKKSRKK